MYNCRVVAIETRSQAEALLKEVGVDPTGVRLMAPKAVFRAIKVEKVSCRAANILKQEMLAKGGEAALHRQAVYGEGETDVLLMGTLRQYELLIEKLKMQAFGLKDLAAGLEQVLSVYENRAAALNLPGNRRLEIGPRTLVMGILNVTPDSFYAGASCMDLYGAVQYARQMVEDGADIIDVGGFSTRPGAVEVEPEEELRRVVPVVQALRSELEDVPISVDTFRAVVAGEALKAGADIINDVSGLTLDPTMIPLAAEAGCPVVIMHHRLGHDYRDLMGEVLGELRKRMDAAVSGGVDERQIIIDPGIGFGKDAEQNLTILRNLEQFRSLGRPLLIGASRKRFIGAVLDLPVDERLEGSLAAAVVSVCRGADIVRVHDVRATRRALDVADAILGVGRNG